MDKKLKQFTLPLKLTKIFENGQFGYLMDLIPKNMVPLGKILSGTREFETFTEVLIAGKNIVRSFAVLHSYNLVFTDVNDGSIFIDLCNGDVVICDCDNIVKDNDSVISLGKMGYMAPEVKLDKRCSKYSDLFSIAVLLYNLFLRDHPFDGEKWQGRVLDDDDRMEKYILNPIFTLHPDDKSNRPSDHISNKWYRLPSDTQDCFIKTFVNHITKNINLRTNANEWKGAIDTWIETLASDPWRILELEPVPKKIQNIIFIVDDSKSMLKGDKIKEVNLAIRDTLSALRDLENANEPVHFEVGVLCFSKDCKWINECSSIDVSKFDFKDIIPTGHLTLFKKVCMLLDDEFSDKSGFIKENNRYNSPFLLLITDGKCDQSTYFDFLEELKTNKIFKKSNKYAIGVYEDESDPDIQMLVDFTGDPDLVVTVDKIKGKLGDLITNVTMSVSSVPGDEMNNERIKEIARDLLE